VLKAQNEDGNNTDLFRQESNFLMHTNSVSSKCMVSPFVLQDP